MKTERYEAVTVLGIPMLFTCERIDHKTIPEELFVYEVRHDDDCQGIPCEINRYIMVNHWGTLISNKPLLIVENGKPVFLDEDDWNYDGYDMTLADYMDKYNLRYIYRKIGPTPCMFELVDHIPVGYRIWNIKMKDYLPLCRLLPCQEEWQRNVDVSCLKAIKTEGAEFLETASTHGYNTLSKMKNALKKYTSSSGVAKPNHKYEVDILRKAIPYMAKITRS